MRRAWCAGGTPGRRERGEGHRHSDGDRPSHSEPDVRAPHTRSRGQALAPALAQSSASSASTSSSDGVDGEEQLGQLWHSSPSDPQAHHEPHGGLPEEGAPSEARSSWFRRLPSLHRVSSPPPPSSFFLCPPAVPLAIVHAGSKTPLDRPFSRPACDTHDATVCARRQRRGCTCARTRAKQDAYRRTRAPPSPALSPTDPVPRGLLTLGVPHA